MSGLSQGTLTPAYGRDYQNKASAIADFQKGLDFLFQSFNGGGYCSIRDAKEGELVKIRYDKGRKVCFYTIAGIDKL